MVSNLKSGLVSVVMPVYNDKRFLTKAIDSILAQTYENFELIIIDSSTDQETIDLIDRYDPKIKYIWKEKRGIANALNAGIKEARGEYIARMDADDISMPDRLEKQVRYLDAHLDTMLLGGQGIIIDEDDNEKGISKNPLAYDVIRAGLVFNNTFWHPTVMFRRKVFEDGFYYDENFTAEDYDLWTRLASGYVIENLPDILIKYRQYGGNTSELLARRVSESVIRSNRNYVRSLWGIDAEKYSPDCFCQYKHFAAEDISPKRLIGEVEELLKEIRERNAENRAIDSELLMKGISGRMNFIYGVYGGKNTIFSLLKDGEEYDLLPDKIQKLKAEKHGIALYGCGIRGRRFLEAVNREAVSWDIIEIFDRKPQELIFRGSSMRTQSIEQINRLSERKWDYIVVSPLDSEEIVRELIGRGVPREKILDAYLLL